jgi:transposase-like protein
LIEQLNRSGLSISAFCEREGISRQSLYRWRSIVGNAGGEQLESRAAPAPATTVTRPDFIDLGALSGESVRLELKLDLGGGVLVHLVRG